MLSFKQYLIESHRAGILKNVADSLNFKFNGDTASKGKHSVSIDNDGYLNLYHGIKHTGVKEIHYDGKTGFIAKAKKALRGKN